ENKKDRCRCYACGITIYHWEPTDNPRYKNNHGVMLTHLIRLEHWRAKSSCTEVASWGNLPEYEKETNSPGFKDLIGKVAKLKLNKSGQKDEIERLKKLGLEQQFVNGRLCPPPKNDSSISIPPEEQLKKAK